MSLAIPTTLTPDLDRRAGRMLAGGRLTATVKSHRTGEHITVRIKCCRNDKDAPYGKRWPTVPPNEATHVFVEAGSRDQVGTIYPQNHRYQPVTNADPAREYAAAMTLLFACGNSFESEIVEADQCGCCGRKLTDPVSIARGIGPECANKQTTATHQTRQHTTQQLTLIERNEETRAIRLAERIEDTEVTITKIIRDGGDPTELVEHLDELKEQQ